jgi:hypothetical protein
LPAQAKAKSQRALLRRAPERPNGCLARARGSDSTRRVGDEDVTCIRYDSTVRSHVAAGTLLSERTFSGQTKEENTMGRGLLLWLIGIPIPIILLISLFGGLH